MKTDLAGGAIARLRGGELSGCFAPARGALSGEGTYDILAYPAVSRAHVNVARLPVREYREVMDRIPTGGDRAVSSPT